MMKEVAERSKRAVVAAVQLPGVSDVELDASVTELCQLAKTLGFEVVGTFPQTRRRFGAGGHLGLGKREEVRRFVCGEREPEQGTSPADDEETAESDEALESTLASGARRSNAGGAGREAKPAEKTAKRAA